MSAYLRHLDAIRSQYKTGGASLLEGRDPYSVRGAYEGLTSIEEQLWCDIRCAGLPMFMQYPVGPYTLDFADPTRKIALEADGKAFHDKARDTERDQRLLEQFGWKVFRVTGSECVKRMRRPADIRAAALENDRADPGYEGGGEGQAYYMGTAEGVVSAIRSVYYEGRLPTLYGPIWLSLDSHKLASFDIPSE